MKQIIGGKLYNTETAEYIDYDCSSCGKRDFRWYNEELYRKKNGEFFLCGEGGPMTKYAAPCGSSGWSSGSRIIPLSFDEAKQWGEDNMRYEKYVEVFGEPEE